MPWTTSRRLSTVVKEMSKVARQEQRAAIRDIGLKARDLARANAVAGLRKDIKVSEVKETAQTLYVEVGSESKIVKWNEEGTGVYGPTGQRITPKNAKALAWQVKGPISYGKGVTFKKGRAVRPMSRAVTMIFRRSVAGVKGRWFIKRAIQSPELANYRRARMKQMTERIKAAAK
jgi:hypothetical protein